MNNGPFVDLTDGVTKLGTANGQNVYFFFMSNKEILHQKKQMDIIRFFENKRVMWHTNEIFSGDYFLAWSFSCNRGWFGLRRIIFHRETRNFFILFHESIHLGEVENFIEEINGEYANELRSLKIEGLGLGEPLSIFRTAPGFFVGKLLNF